MKQIILIAVCMLMTLAGYGQQVLAVKKNDAQSLLAIIQQANEINAAADAKRLYVIIPDGFYDLGKTVLTQITGHNIAFIGQSMEGTVIQNAPDPENEGISKTAVLQNRGTGNYFQDLTGLLCLWCCWPCGDAARQGHADHL